MKKIFSLFLAMALLIGCIPVNAHAEEAVYPKVTHNYTTTDNFASDDWSTDQRGAYLGNGRSTIARADSTHINISGNTNATQTCDKVRLTLFVERSTSYATGYSTYKSYSYSADNAYQLGKEISNIKVDRGYYYRVFAVHSVTENGVTETTDSVTNPIDYR
ncbi:MAG: hypothetical protein IIV45_05500 [Lachnospiraceae bacterium]|nr:hypothetical protein [Lachnospiraceae bacterium]